MTYEKLLYVMSLRFDYVDEPRIIADNCSKELQNYQIEAVLLKKNQRLSCRLSFWIRGKLRTGKGKIIGIGFAYPCSRVNVKFREIIAYLNRLIDMPPMIFPETQEEWEELHHISRILAPNIGWND